MMNPRIPLAVRLRPSLAAILLLLLSGEPAVASSPPEPLSLPPGFVEGNNAFAFALFRETRTDGENLAFSPLGISTCMAMVYAGARGPTAEEMVRTLEFGAEGDTLNQAFATLLDGYAALGSKGPMDLKLVNGAWKQEGHGFLNEYRDLLQKSYRAEVSYVDFIGHARGARRYINRWCSQQTEGKIQEILDVVGFNTRLVVANCVYFRGEWDAPFPKDATQPRPFHLAPGDSVQVPTMRDMRGARFYEDETVQVLRLPYPGGGFSMLFVLPREPGKLGDLAANLEPELLEHWVSNAEEWTVRISLPRFVAGTDLDLRPSLEALGMTLVFGDGADLSGMDGKHELFLSQARHGAWLEVDEKGTEAAAATVGVIPRKSASTPSPARFAVFRADHPFLFLLRDEASGSILFLGQVIDPRGK